MGEESSSIDQMEEEQLRATAELVSENSYMIPSNPITQWKGVILATIAAKKLRANIRDLKPEVDPASQLDYLMVVHAALVQQFNAFGIVLTLLAAVTSVAILQPPGSFDQSGHLQTSTFVACFVMFSSLSFLLACTGLMAVVVGSTSLFRPWFFPKPPSGSEEIKKIVTAGQGTNDGIVYDDIPTLSAIILDNLLRVRRLRMYLALSLGLCMVAFVCGARAILGPPKRNQWMALGTILGSGVVFLVETGFTLAGPTHPPKWLRKCTKILVNVGISDRIDPGLNKTTSGNIRNTMNRT